MRARNVISNNVAARIPSVIIHSSHVGKYSFHIGGTNWIGKKGLAKVGITIANRFHQAAITTKIERMVKFLG